MTRCGSMVHRLQTNSQGTRPARASSLYDIALASAACCVSDIAEICVEVNPAI